MIEALAKGVEGPAEQANTPVLAGLLTHSPTKENLMQHHRRSSGMMYLSHKDRLRLHEREEKTAPLLRALLLEGCRDLDPFHAGIGVSVDDLPGSLLTAIDVRDAQDYWY